MQRCRSQRETCDGSLESSADIAPEKGGPAGLSRAVNGGATETTGRSIFLPRGPHTMKSSSSAMYAENAEPDRGSPPNDRRDQICVHIFQVSATLVGVCLTVLGLLRIVRRLHPVGTLADEILTLDALLFLGSCMMAYAALRAPSLARRRKLERIADAVFLGGLGLMTLLCALIAYELI